MLPPQQLAQAVHEGKIGQLAAPLRELLLAVQDFDARAHAMTVDVLLKQRQPLIHGLLDPAADGVGHDAHNSQGLSSVDDVDDGSLQLIDPLADVGHVGQGLPEPGRDLVAQIRIQSAVARGHPLRLLLHVLLEELADPRRGAQRVVPVEEDQRPLGREGARQGLGVRPHRGRREAHDVEGPDAPLGHVGLDRRQPHEVQLARCWRRRRRQQQLPPLVQRRPRRRPHHGAQWCWGRRRRLRASWK
mmetsp:Transcript_5740/g.21822  ORF Transcript_5740/g.21822 Transcript_5740/m.21822 type:complete len:245 (-) Transcript_5740:1808-2542(-)